MGKIFCSECGAELDDSIKFCPKCGTKITYLKEENFENYCPECGEKLNNGICKNCNTSPSNSHKSLMVIILGYLLASFSEFPLLGIFGVIFGIYLIYKGHKDLFRHKLNKTNVNGVVICLLSIIGIFASANYASYFVFALIVFIILNVAIKTDDNEYYDLNGKSKYVLLILIIVLALLLIGFISNSISNQIYYNNVMNGLNDTSYLEGNTYDTNINGLTFHIPENFKETDRANDSDSEIALFEDDNQHSFTIYASTSGLTPNHGNAQGGSQKTFGGVDGEMTFYTNKIYDRVKGEEKVTSAAIFFAYQTNGQVVEIDVSECDDEVLNILIDN